MDGEQNSTGPGRRPVRVPQTERAQSAQDFFSRLLAHVDVNKAPDTPSESPKITRVLSNVRGFVLGNYKVPMLEQVLLKVATPAKALVLLARMVSGRKD
jgi:hypothetical protein